MVYTERRSSGYSPSSTQRGLIIRAVQILLWILMMGYASTSVAADFGLESNSDLEGRQWMVTLRGEIEAGDANRLQAFLRQRVPPEEDAPDFWRSVAISLDSTGGNFAEGLRIGKFINSSGIRTLVQNGNICASSCALAFLGGSAVTNEGYAVDRSLEVGGKLQFHAPYVDPGNVTTDRAKLVKQLTDVNIELLQAMTNEFEVPSYLISTLLRNDDAHSLYTVSTVQMVVELGIDVPNLYQPKSLTLEMATNLCINTNAFDQDIPGDDEFEQSRRIQQTEEVLRITNDGDSEAVAIPVPVKGEPEGSGYCFIGRSKRDGNFWCSDSRNTMTYDEIVAARDPTTGDGCAIKARPPELFLVRVETELEDYQSVVQKMEVRGKSVFDIAVVPPTSSEKPSNGSSG